MRKREKKALQEVWKKMSTEELDELLHMELHKDLPDDEHVRGILSVLEEREHSCPVEITDEVQAAWEKYKRAMEAPKVLECEKPARSRKWIVGAAAAAAVLVVLFAPRTVGAESVFQVLYRWTAETFEFISPGERVTNTKGEYAFETDNPGLQQVYDKVVEMGITEPVVPMWLPEGYELTELSVSARQSGEMIYAAFSRENMLISLSYFITGNEVANQYEYQNGSAEEYQVADTTHFVISNENKVNIVWRAENVECFIVSSLSKEEIYKMIKSIHRREP